MCIQGSECAMTSQKVVGVSDDVNIIQHANVACLTQHVARFGIVTDGYSSYLSPFCQASVFAKHAMAVFIPSAVLQKMTPRIDDLLHVEVLPNDGLPQHIHEKCKRRLETLERAAEDLENFHGQASASYTV